MRTVCLLLVLHAALVLACTAQEAGFDHIAKAFIQGINEPDRASSLAGTVFSERLRPKAAAIFNDMSQRYGHLQFHHAEAKPSLGDPSRFLMHIYAKGEQNVMYTDFQLLTVSGGYEIDQILFIAEVAEPISLPNSGIEEPYTLRWLDNYIGKLQTENDLYGSILIAKGSDILYEKYFGYMDAAKTKPTTAATAYSIASGGKMFTAIALMQLVEQGKLQLDDPITRYISGFPDMQQAQKIQIRHLLSHTSGVNEYWSGQRIPEIENQTTLQPVVDYVLTKGFAFEPGADYQYCNSNFILLGAIIESAGGMNFFDFVQKNIFDKLHMDQTAYLELADPIVAQHLGRDAEDPGKWIALPHGRRGTSAGGVVSTPADILTFSLGLRDGKLISRSNLALMTQPQNSPHGQGDHYGYGFIIEFRSDEATYGHGGTAGGTNFEFRYFPKQDISLILMNNQNNGAYDDLKRNTLKLISGER